MWEEVRSQVLSIAFVIGILGNLTASLLWAFPVILKLHRKIDKNHAEHMAAIRLHHSGRDVRPDSDSGNVPIVRHEQRNSGDSPTGDN